MQISEKLDIIIEKHHYYKSLNKKLLEDESIVDYSPWNNSYQHGDTASFSAPTTNSKSIELIISWIKGLIINHHPDLKQLKREDTWFVRYKVGEESKPHKHHPSLYSWVYFVNCPKGSSPFVFTTSGKRIKAEEGKVLIFPSIIKHHVPKSRCDNRVVLVGNLITT